MAKQCWKQSVALGASVTRRPFQRTVHICLDVEISMQENATCAEIPQPSTVSMSGATEMFVSIIVFSKMQNRTSSRSGVKNILEKILESGQQ
eukprot:3027431-Amphidinium_carterae.1